MEEIRSLLYTILIPDFIRRLKGFFEFSDTFTET